MSTGIDPGSVHGMLTYIRPTGIQIKAGRRCSAGLFACRCGNYVTRVLRDVKRGHPKSCGCLRGIKQEWATPDTGLDEIEGDTPYTPSHPAARLVKARHSQGGTIGCMGGWTGGRSSLERMA